VFRGQVLCRLIYRVLVLCPLFLLPILIYLLVPILIASFCCISLLLHWWVSPALKFLSILFFSQKLHLLLQLLHFKHHIVVHFYRVNVLSIFLIVKITIHLSIAISIHLSIAISIHLSITKIIFLFTKLVVVIRNKFFAHK